MMLGEIQRFFWYKSDVNFVRFLQLECVFTGGMGVENLELFGRNSCTKSRKRNAISDRQILVSAYTRPDFMHMFIQSNVNGSNNVFEGVQGGPREQANISKIVPNTKYIAMDINLQLSNS